MKMKVHRFVIDMEKDQQRLEEFLNSLEGEVVSIVPNIDRTSLRSIYGWKRRINFLFIIERLQA